MSSDSVKDQLRGMSEQLSTLIETADSQEDHLLGALLCDAHERVIARYAELPQK